jgi:hypothetical protein
MFFLEEYYADSEMPTLTEVNDILSFDWKWLYDCIGMSDNEEDDEDSDEEEEE